MAKNTFAQAVEKAKKPESDVTILSFDQNEIEDRISFRHFSSIIKNAKNQYKAVELKNFKSPLNNDQISVITNLLNDGINNFSITNTIENEQTIFNVNKNSQYCSINLSIINYSDGKLWQSIINEPLNEKIKESINIVIAKDFNREATILFIKTPLNYKCIIDPNSHLFILDDRRYDIFANKQSCLIRVNISSTDVEQIESSICYPAMNWTDLNGAKNTIEYIKNFFEKSDCSNIKIKFPPLNLIKELYNLKISSNVKNIMFQLCKSNILAQNIDGITCNDLFKKWFEQGIKTHIGIEEPSLKNIFKLNQYSFAESIDIYTIGHESLNKNILEDLEKNVHLKKLYLGTTHPENSFSELQILYFAYTGRNKVIHKLLPDLLNCDFTKVDLSKPLALDVLRFFVKFSRHFDDYFNDVISNQSNQYVNLKGFILDNYFTIKNGIKGVAIDQETNNLSPLVKNQIVEYINEPFSLQELSAKGENIFIDEYQKTLNLFFETLDSFNISQIYEQKSTEQMEMIGASSPETDLDSI